jgi:hypothetical protein
MARSPPCMSCLLAPRRESRYAPRGRPGQVRASWTPVAQWAVVRRQPGRNLNAQPTKPTVRTFTYHGRSPGHQAASAPLASRWAAWDSRRGMVTRCCGRDRSQSILHPKPRPDRREVSTSIPVPVAPARSPLGTTPQWFQTPQGRGPGRIRRHGCHSPVGFIYQLPGRAVRCSDIRVHGMAGND